MPNFGVSFVQASSDATRRLCEQGQSVAKTISEWNTEVNHFLSHRVAQNGETLGRMTKCQNLPRFSPFKRNGYEKLLTTT